MLVFALIDRLEILCDCLIHLISVTNELVLHDDRPHHRVAALHPHDFFRCGVEGLHVANPEVLVYLPQDLVVV